MFFKIFNAKKSVRGAKTETRKLKKPRVKAGKMYSIRTNRYKREDWGRIKILALYQERLGAITKEGIRREGCKTRQEFDEMFDSINGHVHRNRKVYVVRYRYIGYV